MTGEQSAYELGMRVTRRILAQWNHAPWTMLRPWAGLSLAISLALLIAVWLVAISVPEDASPGFVPGVSDGGGWLDIGRILANNLLVLALHGTACVAGFIAGASMPAVAAEKEGFSRALHLHAGRIAIFMVVVITTFSLVTQAYALGLQGASLASWLEISEAALLVSAIPHALPELTALFLPLAAWMLASRHGHWDRLLAATVITVAVALPVLVVTAVAEVELWPRILERISPVF